MAGDVQELRTHLARRQQAGAAGDHQRAAGERAPAIGRAVGVAVNDLDALRRNAKLVGDDLGERGAQALTVRAGADAQFDKAGRVHRQLDRFPARRHAHAARGERGRAVAGALGKSRKADAEITAVPRAPRCWRWRNAGTIERVRPPSPASADRCLRRTPDRSPRCREISRSGCGGGFRPARGRIARRRRPSAAPAPT